MPRKILAVALGAAFLAALCPSTLVGQANAAKIAGAMTTAPASIAKDATVFDWPDASGKMAVVKQGTNGWTCMRSQPASGEGGEQRGVK